MALLLSLLIVLLVCLFGGLYVLGFFRQRRPGEPPLDKGLIPWLGHVLEFRQNTYKFIERMMHKHGDVFTVQLGGHYITFLQDPLSFGALVKESRGNVDFGTFAKQTVYNIFGYVGGDHRILDAASHKHLKGDGLKVMTEAMMGNLQNLMLYNLGSASNQRTWTESGLFQYCCNTLFRAGYLSMYGNATSKTEGSEEKAKAKDRAESEVLFHKFLKYDKLVPNLAYGILPPKGRMEAHRLKSFFWNALSIQKMQNKDNISSWILDMRNLRREIGMDEIMIDRYMFVLLWASQGNTGPSAFWLLLYLIKHPDALEALRREADKVLKESNQEVRPGGPLIDLTWEMLMKTPVLDSAVEEILRLVTAPVLTRSVLQDMNLKMDDGREFLMRKGDRIAMFPYISLHIDPEIHPDPHSFKYDRFLSEDGAGKKTHFYKGGKRVKYYSMPWGSGVSMCPGRFFATNELKQFVFLMLVYFDFELINQDEKIPQIDYKRWGFGIMHPDREIQFRYRFRY